MGLTRYTHGIAVVDAHYGAPQKAAIHLVREGDRVAIIDTGVNASAPGLHAALDELGVHPEQVSLIILTHIHLDHAGGAGTLMQLFGQAQLVVHPRGARHMMDPTRLVAGTVEVYGATQTQRMYGDILPVEADRVVEVADGETIDFNGRALTVLHTPGHALHHLCLVDSASGHIFSGDTFGLSYRHLDRDGRAFIFPTTTPVQFDPAALHASIDRLRSFEPDAIYLTHYGRVTDVPRLADDLHRLVEQHAAIARSAAGFGDERLAAIRAGLERLVREESAAQAWALQGDDAVELLTMDLDLNARGLNVWLERGERDRDKAQRG